jgi:hypothetical protein
VCDELQMLDSSTVIQNAVELGGPLEERGRGRKRERERERRGEPWSRKASRCFLPFLLPTPNFSSTDECSERYRYMFNPSPLSGLHVELYTFLGQLVGMAVRSKITLDLALPSYIWKCIAREPLTEKDIASFDAPSARFIHRLGSLYSRVKTQEKIRASWPTGLCKSSELAKSSSVIDKSVSISLPRLGSMGRKGSEEPALPASLSSPPPLSVTVPAPAGASVTATRTPRDPVRFKNRPAGVESCGSETGEKTVIQASVSTEASMETDTDTSCGDTPAMLLLAAEMQEALQDLDWTYVRSDGRTVELIQGGLNKPVTVGDVGQYLQLYIEARLLEGDVAIQAFRSGLNSIIPESAFYLTSWEDVERIVCGSRNIDIARLQENTDYDDDVTAEDPHIKHFWETLTEFSEDEKILFLKFVWARPTLPPKGMEFQQRMKIQSAVGDDAAEKPDLYLPKAHTCFFSINLPRYSTKKVHNSVLFPLLRTGYYLLTSPFILMPNF